MHEANSEIESAAHDETGAPRCVGDMLARFERVARTLENGAATGPYALDALLDDIEFCPSLQNSPAGASGIFADLQLALTEARNAVAVARKLPASERTWAAERLIGALNIARKQFELRVAEAAANDKSQSLFSPRCTMCTFK